MSLATSMLQALLFPTPDGTGASAAHAPFAYAGGYAPQCGGIHALRRDAEGRVTATLAAELPGSPTWLHLTPDGRRLHALLEDSHELASFDVHPLDGGLTLVARRASGGQLPVHLDWRGDHAWIAHYGDGRLCRVPVDQEGALGAPDLVLSPRDGATSHTHMVRRHPRRPLMVATDLGQDLLRVWRLDGPGTEDGTPVELEPHPLPPGSGPRHFVFDPYDDDQLYLLNEGANALDWLGLDAQGRVTSRDRLSSLPASFEGLSYASDLLMAPDGRRLYALNRLHDAIAVFFVDARCRPTWAGEVWAQGSYPRSATFSPDGSQLWVCLQRSHQICVFELGDEGVPRFGHQFIAMPGAACVVFR